MTKKNVNMYILILLGCCITGCNIKDLDSENSKNTLNIELSTEADNTIVYADEKQKEVVYGELLFDMAFYHIRSTIKNDESETFYCEVDSDMKMPLENRIIKIQKNTESDIRSFEEAREYFDSFASYDRLNCYQDIEDESGIVEVYAAVSNTASYYLVYCNEESYLIESNDRSLESELLEQSIGDFLKTTHAILTIECAEAVDAEMIATISYPDKSAAYELYKEKNIINAKAVLKIIPIEENHQHSFTLYNAEEQEIQQFDWISRFESYPEFLDVNQDGCVDMQVMVDQGTSYDAYDFYIWNKKVQSYEKVIYDGILSEIEVKNGYLYNWVRSGDNYVLEKLVWEDNKLIKDSEEIVGPDKK